MNNVSSFIHSWILVIFQQYYHWVTRHAETANTRLYRFGRIYIYLSFKGEITDYDISSIAIITYTSIELDLRPRSSLSLVFVCFWLVVLFREGFFIPKLCSSMLFFVIGVIFCWEGKMVSLVGFKKKKK